MKKIVVISLSVIIFFIVCYFILGAIQMSSSSKISNEQLDLLVPKISKIEHVDKVEIVFRRPSIRINVYIEGEYLTQEKLEQIFNFTKDSLTMETVNSVNERIGWSVPPDTTLNIYDNNRAYFLFVGTLFAPGTAYNNNDPPKPDYDFYKWTGGYCGDEDNSAKTLSLHFLKK